MNIANATRLRRARHGANDVTNADRLAHVLAQRGVALSELSPAAAARIAAQLPSLIRAESQSASAAANELGVHEMLHHSHAERARTLDFWARECVSLERQQAALRVLARRDALDSEGGTA